MVKYYVVKKCVVKKYVVKKCVVKKYVVKKCVVNKYVSKKIKRLAFKQGANFYLEPKWLR